MSEKKTWHPKFLKYMETIVNHQNYKDIPFVRNKAGKIKWLEPKVNSVGQKRIDWVLRKAKVLNLDPIPGIYAKVMFHIHPMKEKPCQICGKTMSIRYIYANRNFVKALKKLDIMCSDLDTIFDICKKIKEKYGEDYLISFIEKKFRISINKREDIISIGDQCENLCRQGCCKLLGPGAMSNFPDRLDGFHSYNRCCRKKEDTGRHDENMKTYNKDRRAYEYWSDGNIYAANKFMNSKVFQNSSADHIGPISLGFKHDSLLLQRMPRLDNSSKRDRLTIKDIEKLIEIENYNPGFSSASWFIEKIWCVIKDNHKKNLDLKKYRNILKENMYLFMNVLKIIKNESKGIDFLTKKLLLPKFKYFDYDYKFNERGQILSKIKRNKTESSNGEYNRFIRISMDAIDNYMSKNNRRIKISFSTYEEQLLFTLKEKLSQEDFDGALNVLHIVIDSIQVRLCGK